MSFGLSRSCNYRRSFLLIGLACILSSCQSLATISNNNNNSKNLGVNDAGSARSPSLTDVGIEKDLLLHAIRSGRVYQHENFLSQAELDWVLGDIQRLREAASFTRSGLSDTSRGGKQGFGDQDRSVSPVPWWRDSLQGKALPDNNVLAPRLEQLRHWLASALDRPTMHDEMLAHECYYSISGQGSFLPRHMDDKHEDLKGAKGWLLPSRRSLSWLLYLGDSDWSLAQNGGALRTFPARRVATPLREPTHDGNLQIGWLHYNRHEQEGSLPVYLDSWVTVTNGDDDVPHAILYTLPNENNQNNKRRVLTQPWRNDLLPPSLLPMDFLRETALHDAQQSPASDDQTVLFLNPLDAAAFALLEDRNVWDQGHDPVSSDVVDIVPIRGSLVVFDSVLLPHQVEIVKRGERVALAGWFHERTQAADLFRG